MSYDTDPNQTEQSFGEHIYAPLVLAAEADPEQLSVGDVRALQIREACFQIVDYIDAIGEEAVNPSDVAAQAAALAGYYEGYATLRDLGVRRRYQAHRRNEDYEDPLILAGKLGGDWMGVTDVPIHPRAQVLRQIQEMSEGKAKIGSNEMYAFSPAELPDAQDWTILRSLCNITDEMLARELGRPELPPVISIAKQRCFDASRYNLHIQTYGQFLAAYHQFEEEMRMRPDGQATIDKFVQLHEEGIKVYEALDQALETQRQEILAFRESYEQWRKQQA